VAAITSLALFLTTPSLTAYAFAFLISLILLFIVVYDVRHTVIPWSASILLILLAALYLFISLPPLYDIFAGPVLAVPLFLLWLLSRGRWMGLGDSVLELGIGSLLGLTAGLTAFFLAFWIGAVVGIALMVLGRGVTMKSEVPFAPFLIAGMALCYFFHVDFFQALPNLF
jgi:prepilin signal peptidase PulO-like enzyme (type II secretory pathway)